MHSDERRAQELVNAARTGDPRAREALAAAYLPLVYNIVGRALDGHADVDDVVQETMVRALDGLDALRDPARFRSWLIAIAMNQIRRRWRTRQQQPLTGLDTVAETPDPAGDFVDLTILRLGLSGQRREVARATRWLDADDRELLALWWLEAAGELDRAELAEALAVDPGHAAVRVRRMKEQLETGRGIVRALAAEPRCPALADTIATWDGRPSPLWRKRIARHLRECRSCSGAWSGLAPAEGLLAGLALITPLLGAGAGLPGAGSYETVAAGFGEVSVSGPGGVPAPRDGHGGVPAPGPGGVPGPRAGGSGGRRVALAGGAAVVAAALLVALWPERDAPPGPVRPAAAPPVTPAATTEPPPSPSAPPRPSVTATPKASRTAPRLSAVERLTRIVNQRRAEAGCGPLRTDPRLVEAARAHARDMVAQGYFDHASPDGRNVDARVGAAGYRWSLVGENLAAGRRDPGAVVGDWMDSDGHRRNMLDCRFRDTGVAAVPGPDGTVWVQTLAKPS
ncbi:sigma-70 family RNA polymerase sigma factor [Streptomyces solicathayae]|uniref:RNA polymerase sigma factor n=1 Tax=Streptomyces solicathayae TaxID=3081768 RepID=A0ABZ0M2L9_9ACTN|nr:sigma-70 family RNA polymerase sigma factor [Streptomyces sp. HUAS YS2]WOX26018.1 sigma-70 family RNA polymerase sigma factor [Streptomyces sp. HUAS YS2]